MNNAKFIIGLFLILLGVGSLTGYPVMHIFLPAVLIVIGLNMLSGRKAFSGSIEPSAVSQSEIKELVIFSGFNKVVESNEFAGGKVMAIFGGGDLDISSVKPESKTVEMEVGAIFGGVKLTVPKDWKVVSEGVAILGGFDNKAGSSKSSTVLKIKGVAIFGGVEVISKES
ncbi:cell wall-active antibiotics response protein [Candidatus Roizmanbacteria bacterium]|nr:cell wall-active antibiotics response protein [Candidatus Roizmanbacteria bacterium]